MKVELKGCRWRTLVWTYVDYLMSCFVLDLIVFDYQREYQVGGDHSPTSQGSPHVRRKSVLPGKITYSTRSGQMLMVGT